VYKKIKKIKGLKQHNAIYGELRTQEPKGELLLCVEKKLKIKGRKQHNAIYGELRTQGPKEKA